MVLKALASPPWRSRIVLGLALVVGVVYLQLRWMAVTWMGDDGYFFVGAQRLLRGEVVYRDFMLHITPGTYYFLAAVLRLTGESWETTRVLWLLCTLIQTSAVFVLVQRLTSSSALAALGFALIASKSALGPVFLHHHLSAVVALGSTWAWWRWLETRQGRYALLAGLADGLVGFTSQNKGFFMLAASVALILLLSEPTRKAKARTLGFYALGGGAVAACFIAVLWAQGSAAGFYRDAIVWVLRGYSQGSHVPYASSYGFLDSQRDGLYLAHGLHALWLAACAPAAAAIEAAISFRRRTIRPATALLALQGLAHWASALHRPDLDHLLLAAALPSALLLVQLHQTRALPWPRAKYAAGVFAGLLALSCVLVASGVARETRDLPRIQLPSLGPRVWTPDLRLAQTVNGLAKHLSEHSAPDEPIFVLPHSSLYYVALRRPNATPYEIPAEAPGMEEQIRDVIAQLDRRQVRYVVVDEMWTPEFEHILFPKLERSFLQGRLMEYVRKQYRLDVRFPKASLYRRVD